MSKYSAAITLILSGAAFSALAAEPSEKAASARSPAEPQPLAPPTARERDRIGRLIRVPLPITESVDQRVRRSALKVIGDAKRAGKWPVLIFELAPGPGEFGKTLDLANFLSGPQLAGATTVAYLPQTITGHGVLLAIACEEILMAADAEIGDAGHDEPVIGPALRSAYVDVASRRKTVPVDVVMRMLDRELEVLEVETEVSREFVLASRLEDFKQAHAIRSSKVLIPPGQPGLFAGRRARELGFVTYLAPDRRSVARALALSVDAIRDDPSLEEGWRPIRVPLKGPINSETVRQVQRLIEDAIRQDDVNFINIWIDSPGGSPTDSIQLAGFLADLDAAERRTVAYIASEARADAAFVAIACDQVVMQSEATFGGSGAANIHASDIPLLAESIREIALRNDRSGSLAAALVDPKVAVYRYTRTSDGLVEFLSADDAARQDDPEDWSRGDEVTTPGRPLQLSGDEAVELAMAESVVDDFARLKQLYGLENDPMLVEPGWADTLIDALKSPSVSWVLLLLGFAAIYAELHAPGIGFGGLIGGVCLLLYFWANYLGGTAGWLEVILFCTGATCLALEVFVLPGFGIFGLLGGIMVLSSLVLASQTFVVPHNDYQVGRLRDSLLTLGIAGAGALGAAMLLRRLLPRTPGLRGIVLEPMKGQELAELSRRESLASFEDLVGSRGVTLTQLTPSGKAIFGERMLDVIAEGDLIEPGTAVVVVQGRGNRIVVRAV